MSRNRKVTSLRKGWQVHEEGHGWLTVESSYTLDFVSGRSETHILYVEPFEGVYESSDRVPTRTLTEQANAVTS